MATPERPASQRQPAPGQPPPGRKPPPPPPEEGKKKRRRGEPDIAGTDLNMTPMIDCVFQLLIFFMCATKFKTLEGKLLAYLPKDKGLKNVKIEEQKLPIRVTLMWNAHTRQAKVYVGQQYMGIADKGGLKAAESRVREIKTTGTEKAEIDAEPKMPFKYVVETLNALIRTRVKEISFAAAPPS
ncbi:MAG: biopolymer transporter ExbD [Planctomycetales bacterium]|nr:biopolymer transporter ExbD [Planctomycetales bacterium]